jgi:hypothetical protein
MDNINKQLSNWHERMKTQDSRLVDDAAPQVEQVTFQVVLENDQVLLRFAKPVAWVAFTPEQAMIVAQDIVNRVKEIGGDST